MVCKHAILQVQFSRSCLSGEHEKFSLPTLPWVSSLWVNIQATYSNKYEYFIKVHLLTVKVALRHLQTYVESSAIFYNDDNYELYEYGASVKILKYFYEFSFS